MTRARRIRRAGVSLLAGGGLTAIGLAGPLTPGSSAQAPSGSALAVTAPASSAPARGPAAPPATPAPAAPTVTSTAPSSNAPPATSAPAAAPTVTAQRSQPGGDASGSSHTRPAAPRTAPVKAAPPSPAPSALTPAKGPNGVALPPQLLAGQFGVLTAGTVSPALAAQALRFYRIPLFLLPIYQAAAIQYGVPWQVLAGINEVETDYGHDLSVSTAGALGWMQFLPETWLQYGVDATHAGFADPYNPADAIFAAARYLRAAGATTDLRSAIFAYNHSSTYVSSVLLRARLIASYPEPVVASLTGLAEGRPPVADGQLPAAPGAGAAAPRSPHGPRFVQIAATRGEAAVAVQDGRVTDMGHSAVLGNYLVLRDVYGDAYTYAGLGSVARYFAVPVSPTVPRRPATPLAGGVAGHDPRPGRPASAGVQPPITLAPVSPVAAPAAATAVAATKVRLFAHASVAPRPAARVPSIAPPNGTRWAILRRGAIVTVGTRLGTLHDAASGGGGFLRFAVQPAGDPRTVDPAPLLTNWRLLDAAANPAGPGSGDGLLGATAGDVFLLSKSELQRQVLADPTISIYGCGRQDIASGAIDPRVLAVLAYLSRTGLKPTVSGLKCGLRAPTSSPDAAESSFGDGVDISAINGISIAGHQGSGSITDATIRALLNLQGRFAPLRIVSLMSYPGTTNTRARRDHADRIHIGFRPATPSLAPLPSSPTAARAARSPAAIADSPPPLTQRGWEQLISRLAAIPAPRVVTHPSVSAVPDPNGSASGASTATRSLRLPFRSR